jgi:uncharacterized membrane protein YbhN (UPF0104 family)
MHSLPDLRFHVERRPRAFLVLGLVAALLFLGALAGVASIAGFRAVVARLEQPDCPWLLAAASFMLVAFLGYRLAYQGISDMRGGPRLDRRDFDAVVAAGFGGFVARGGAAVDNYIFRAAADAGPRDAEVRVGGLGALEHVPIALGGCAAAVYLLANGVHTHPPLDFLWPWALAPPLGGALAVWAAARFRTRLRRSSGWRDKLGIGLDSVWMLLGLARELPDHGLSFVGITLFWAADLAALWAGMASFHFQMPAAQLVIGYSIGYALTRRSAPLGGAGLIETALPLTLWDSGAPLAAAVSGVLAYRFFNLWAPMPVAFAALPRLRAIAAQRHRG